MTQRRRLALVMIGVLAMTLGVLGHAPVASAFGGNPFFYQDSGTNRHNWYIQRANQVWSWANHGFVTAQGWSRPCGQHANNQWGCWIERRWQRWKGIVGYGWHIQSYQVWDAQYQWINSGYGQPYTAWQWVNEPYTAERWVNTSHWQTYTAYHQETVQKYGWLTLSQNVWEPSPTPLGIASHWYFIAVPQWMVNWGDNPAALDGPPNPGSITPGPTSPGSQNGGKMVTETTKYWGPYLTTIQVPYTAKAWVISGYQQSYTAYHAVWTSYAAYRWINTSHWQGAWVTTYRRIWGPNYGWVWGDRGPGRPCTDWYSRAVCR